MADAILNLNVEVVGLYDKILSQFNRAEKAINRTRFRINDRTAVEPLGRIAKSASDFEKSLAASNARVIAFGASVGIIAGVQRAFSELVRQTIAVEKALADINVVLNTTDLEGFSNKLFKAAKLTGQSFETAAEAALEFSRQGLGVEETLKRTSDALILVRRTGIDAGKAVQGLTAIINGFQKDLLDTSVILNKFVAVDTAFSISAGDLVEAFSRVGSAAQDAGVDFDELVGIITSARQITGRSASVIGNSFKTIFTRLQGEDTLAALENIGIATTNASGGFRDSISILTDLAKRYDTLTDSQQAFISKQVGGVYQINVLKATLGDLSNEYGIYQRALKTSLNASDEATRGNERLNKTLAANVAQLKTSLVQLFAALGKGGLDQPITKILNIGQQITDSLNASLGQEAGSEIAKGIVRGLGNILSGPGLVAVAAIITRLFTGTAKFALDSFKSLFGLTRQTQQIKALQSQINEVLAQQGTSYDRILSKTGSRIDAEREVLRLIQQQNAARQTSLGGVGSSLYSQGLRFDTDKGIFRTGGIGVRSSVKRAVRGGAEGILPAIVKEKISVNKRVGGASPNAQPVVIKDFPFGKGRKGPVVVNTDEYIVPNYAGGDGSAVFNKDMVRKYGLPANAKKIMASGFTPTPEKSQVQRQIDQKTGGFDDGVPNVAGGFTQRIANKILGASAYVGGSSLIGLGNLMGGQKGFKAQMTGLMGKHFGAYVLGKKSVSTNLKYKNEEDFLHFFRQFSKADRTGAISIPVDPIFSYTPTKNKIKYLGKKGEASISPKDIADIDTSNLRLSPGNYDYRFAKDPHPYKFIAPETIERASESLNNALGGAFGRLDKEGFKIRDDYVFGKSAEDAGENGLFGQFTPEPKIRKILDKSFINKPLSAISRKFFGGAFNFERGSISIADYKAKRLRNIERHGEAIEDVRVTAKYPGTFRSFARYALQTDRKKQKPKDPFYDFDQFSGGFVPSYANGFIQRNFKDFIGSGIMGEVYRGQGKLSPFVFKAMHAGIEDEYDATKLALQKGLPVARVIGSKKTAIENQGLLKEYVGGLLGRDVEAMASPYLVGNAKRMFARKFLDAGINPRDISNRGNYKVNITQEELKKLSELHAANAHSEEKQRVIEKALVKKMKVIDPGFFTVDSNAPDMDSSRFMAGGFVPDYRDPRTREIQTLLLRASGKSYKEIAKIFTQGGSKTSKNTIQQLHARAERIHQLRGLTGNDYISKLSSVVANPIDRPKAYTRSDMFHPDPNDFAGGHIPSYAGGKPIISEKELVDLYRDPKNRNLISNVSFTRGGSSVLREKMIKVARGTENKRTGSPLILTDLERQMAQLIGTSDSRNVRFAPSINIERALEKDSPQYRAFLEARRGFFGGKRGQGEKHLPLFDMLAQENSRYFSPYLHLISGATISGNQYQVGNLPIDQREFADKRTLGYYRNLAQTMAGGHVPSYATGKSFKDYRFKRKTPLEAMIEEVGGEKEFLEQMRRAGGGSNIPFLQARNYYKDKFGLNKGLDLNALIENISSRNKTSNRKGLGIFEKKVQEFAIRRQLASMPRKLQATGAQSLPVPELNRGQLINVRGFLQGQGKNYQNFAQIKKFLAKPVATVSQSDIGIQRRRYDLQEQLSSLLGAEPLSSDYRQFEAELQAQVKALSSGSGEQFNLRQGALNAALNPKLLTAGSRNYGPGGIKLLPPHIGGGGGGGKKPPRGFNPFGDFDDEEAKYFREILEGRLRKRAYNRQKNVSTQAAGLGGDFTGPASVLRDFYEGQSFESARLNYRKTNNGQEPDPIGIKYPGLFGQNYRGRLSQAGAYGTERFTYKDPRGNLVTNEGLRSDPKFKASRANINQTTYGKTRGTFDFATGKSDLEKSFGTDLSNLTNVQLGGFLGRAVGSSDRATAIRDTRERLFRDVKIKGGKVGNEQVLRDQARFSKIVSGSDDLTGSFITKVKDSIEKNGLGLAKALEKAAKEAYDLGATEDQINTIRKKHAKTFIKIEQSNQDRLAQIAQEKQDAAQRRAQVNDYIKKTFQNEDTLKRVGDINEKYISGQPISRRDQTFYQGRQIRDFIGLAEQEYAKKYSIDLDKLDTQQRTGLRKTLFARGKEEFSGFQAERSLENIYARKNQERRTGFLGGLSSLITVDPASKKRIESLDELLSSPRGNKLSRGQKERFVAERETLKSQRFNEKAFRTQNLAFAGSIAASFIAGIAEESGNKPAAGALQGLGTGASLGSLGFSFGPAVGIATTAIGALGGAIIGLSKASNGTRDILEKLEKQIAESEEAFQKTSDSVSRFLDLSSQLQEGTRTGSLSIYQQERFKSEISKSAGNITPELLTKLSKAGNIKEQADIFLQEQDNAEKQKRILQANESLGLLSEGRIKVVKEASRNFEILKSQFSTSSTGLSTNSGFNEDFRKKYVADYVNKESKLDAKEYEKFAQEYSNVLDLGGTKTTLQDVEKIIKSINETNYRQVFKESFSLEEGFISDLEQAKFLGDKLLEATQKRSRALKEVNRVVEEQVKVQEKILAIVNDINNANFESSFKFLKNQNRASENINRSRNKIASNTSLTQERKVFGTGVSDIRELQLGKQEKLQEINNQALESIEKILDDSNGRQALEELRKLQQDGKSLPKILDTLIEDVKNKKYGVTLNIESLKAIKQSLDQQTKVIEETSSSNLTKLKDNIVEQLRSVREQNTRGLFGGKSPLDVYTERKNNPNILKEIFGNSSDLPRLSLQNTKKTNFGFGKRLSTEDLVAEARALEDQQKAFKELGVTPSISQSNRYREITDRLGRESLTEQFSKTLEGVGLGRNNLNLVKTGDVRNIDLVIKEIKRQLTGGVSQDNELTLKAQLNTLENFKKLLPQASEFGQLATQDLGSKLARELGGGADLRDVVAAIQGDTRNISLQENLGQEADIRFKDITTIFDNLGKKVEGRIENYDPESRSIGFRRGFDNQFFEINFKDLHRSTIETIKNASNFNIPTLIADAPKAIEDVINKLNESIDTFNKTVESFATTVKESAKEKIKGDAEKVKNEISTKVDVIVDSLNEQTIEAIVKDIQAKLNSLIHGQEALKRESENKIPTPPTLGGNGGIRFNNLGVFNGS